MSKVDLTLIERGPDKSLIEHIESILAAAKSGELQEIVYVCGYRNNSVNHGWSKLNNRMRMIGELEQVKWHLLRMDE